MKPKPKPARIVVGYCRVSTLDQAVEGVSLAAQQERITSWALAAGIARPPLLFADTRTGKRADNRPGLTAALDEVCRRSGVLVVYSLSRLARSVRDTIAIADRLDRAKADLVSLTEQIDTTSSMGKMFFRMMAVLAEFERDQIVERTKAALDHKRSLGERIGQIPYGKRLDADGVSLLDDPAELVTLDWIREKRSEGWSLRAIATGLESLELPTKNGGRWSKTTVARLLARESSP